MFLHVTHVEPLEPYRLRLSFDDGAQGEVDLEAELYGETFEPLRDPELFRQARLHPDLGTVFWPTGANFASEFLHELLEFASAEQRNRLAAAIAQADRGEGVDGWELLDELSE